MLFEEDDPEGFNEIELIDLYTKPGIIKGRLKATKFDNCTSVRKINLTDNKGNKVRRRLFLG